MLFFPTRYIPFIPNAARTFGKKRKYKVKIMNRTKLISIVIYPLHFSAAVLFHFCLHQHVAKSFFGHLLWNSEEIKKEIRKRGHKRK
jgi:hypothetical protein